MALKQLGPLQFRGSNHIFKIMFLAKSHLTKLSAIFFSFEIYLFSASQAFAAITNPVIGKLGDDAAKASSGVTFMTYFVSLWRAMMSIGSIMVLVYFAWGAIDWITSGGDKGKVDTARNKITNALIGIIILVSSFTIVGFISNLVFGSDFNLLKLTFPNPADSTTIAPAPTVALPAPPPAPTGRPGGQV